MRNLDVRIFEQGGGLYARVGSESVGSNNSSVMLLRLPLEKRAVMELKGKFEGISTSASVYSEIKETAKAHSDEAYAPFLEAER